MLQTVLNQCGKILILIRWDRLSTTGFLARGHRPAAGYRSTKVVVLLVVLLVLVLLVVVGAYRDQPYPLI